MAAMAVNLLVRFSPPNTIDPLQNLQVHFSATVIDSLKMGNESVCLPGIRGKGRCPSGDFGAGCRRMAEITLLC
jgi:hypothetical protein